VLAQRLAEVLRRNDVDRQSRGARGTMQIGRILGATRILGKAQGYLGLPVRDETINCTVDGPGTPSMVTAWLPTPKERSASRRNRRPGRALHLSRAVV
jgi:hypothetical protein